MVTKWLLLVFTSVDQATPVLRSLASVRAAARRAGLQGSGRPGPNVHRVRRVRLQRQSPRFGDGFRAAGDDPGVTARSNRPDSSTPQPLSKWIIRIGAVVVLAAAVVVAAVSWLMLRRLYGGHGAQVQLDVIRTAGTLVIGIAVALLLTARQQCYTELAFCIRNVTPPSGESPSCTRKPPISWEAIKRRYDWQDCTRSNAWHKTHRSSVRPSWT
jgi:hypothetical protein